MNIITKCLISLLITVSMIFVIITPSSAVVREEWDKSVMAQRLSALGVFKGSNKGFELDRKPTRTEAAVMFVRLLGKETEALNQQLKSPFTDVDEWVSPYIGWMYEHKLTTGIGNNLFGSKKDANAQMYITFLLRALGYTEENGDFSYSNPFPLALSTGMLSYEEMYVPVTAVTLENRFLRSFDRGDLAVLSYRALQCKTKGQNKELIRTLIADGSILESSLSSAGLSRYSSNYLQSPHQISLNRGEYVSLGVYRGSQIVWQVIGLNNDKPVLQTAEIIAYKAFDAAESGTYDDNGDKNNVGSSYWGTSNLRDWLNSKNMTVRYSSQSPSVGSTAYGMGYDTESGFLNGFTSSEVEMIIPYTRDVFLSKENELLKTSGQNSLIVQDMSANGRGRYGMNVNTAYRQSFTDNVFILDALEFFKYYNDDLISPYKRISNTAISDIPQAFLSLYGLPFYALNTPSSDTEVFKVGENDLDGYSGLRAYARAAIPIGISPCVIIDPMKIQSFGGKGTLAEPYILTQQSK